MSGFLKSPPTRVLLLTGLIAATSIYSPAARPASQAGTASQKSEVVQNYGKLPLSFEANQGQTAGPVRFVSRGNGYALYLTDSAAVLSLTQPRPAGSGTSQSATSVPEAETVRMEISGASSQVRIAGDSPLPGVSNYLVGNHPAQWRTNIPTYAKVRYSDIYPGIDLVYYGNQNQLEYDFAIAPGASPNVIRLKFAGQQRLRLAANGDLVLTGTNGPATLHKPVVYQEIEGRRRSIPASFQLMASHSVRFRIGSYDRTRPLVIDPVLTYATYLGGSGGDVANAIAVDSQGSAYITGTTFSLDFPVTSGAYDSTNKASVAQQGSNVFISKFNPTGTALLYSTYLGGSGSSYYGNGDIANAIAVDSKGNAYVAGATYSADFPTTAGAFQTVNQAVATQSGTGFVTKLNSTGSALLYSTFLGGGDAYTDGFPADQVLAIAVDSLGDAFVTGSTVSSAFPVTPGTFQQVLGNIFQQISNAFVTKLNPAGSGLIYSTYLGGSTKIIGGFFEPGDIGHAIAIDSTGNAYVAGRATSVDFPTTPGAYQTTNAGATGYSNNTPYTVGGSNAFLTKLNPTGTALIYSTFFGGNGDLYSDTPANDAALSLAVDRYGDAFVAGAGNSFSAFPESPNFIPEASGFVARFTPDGSSLYGNPYGYYVDVVGYNSAVTSIAVDLGENAYITGSADSGIFPTTDAVPSQLCCAYVAKLNFDGSAFEFSTYLGGAPANSTVAKGLAIDGEGNVYITGSTSSTSLPVTTGAYQSTNKGGGKLTNAYVTKLALGNATTAYLPTGTYVSSTPNPVVLGQVESISATVQAVDQPVSPTGTVTFTGQYVNPNQPGNVTTLAPFTATLNSQGVATWPLTATAVGQYQVSASYPGDANHYGSQSAPITFTSYGPPAKLVETEYINYGVTAYGDPANIATLGMQVTDAAGTGLSGVTINLSPTSDIHYLPYPLVTGTGGYAVVYAEPLDLGEHVVTASVAGVATPLVFPAIYTGPAPLTVTVQNNEKAYGAPVPVSGANVSGLRFSDTVNVVTMTTATASSPVGSYPITATVSGADTFKYDITVLPGTLTVVPARLHITAKNVAVVYGQTPAQPTAYLLTGFANGDPSSIVSGAPVLTTNVTSTTPVGVYPIGVQVGTLSAPNYQFSTTASGEGSVTVYKAPLTIRPANVTIHAGDPLPAFTYVLTGFVNGDSQTTATTGAPVLTTTAPNNTTPGRYYIVAEPGSLAAHNYTFNQPSAATNGILTILPN